MAGNLTNATATTMRTIILISILLAFRLNSVNSGSLSGKKFLVQEEEERQKTFVCPEQNGRFAHEDHCEKYWNCKDFIPQLLSCNLASFLLFDEGHKACVHSADVHCGSRTRPDGVPPTFAPPTTTTSTTPSTTTTSTTTTPSTTTTSTTTTPSTTTTSTTTTPSTTTTSTTTTTPTTTTTSTTTPSTTTTESTTTTTSPITTTTPKPYNCTVNGAFPHPTYCWLYYDCWDGLATLLPCPREELFDVQWDWMGCSPNPVDCGDRLHPFSCPPDGEEGATYPDPYNCSKYFVCFQMSPIHRTCPRGLFYNTILKVCDYPSNVDCTDRLDIDLPYPIESRF